MTELFLFKPLFLIKNLSIEQGFCICIITILFTNFLCLILSLFKREYRIKKRLWSVFISLGASVLMLGIERQKSIFPLGFFVCISTGIIFLFVLFLPNRKATTEVDSKEFARYIDSCVKNPIDEQHYAVKNKAEFTSSLIKSTPQPEVNMQDEIDFSHAKTILSKLEFYPLKEQDRKTAKDLENAIDLAEQNGLDNALKENINEGLGALLKIMAKYAI